MDRRTIITSLIIGGIIGLLIFNIRQLSVKNEQLTEQVCEQDNNIKDLSSNIENLIKENESLTNMTKLNINEKLLYIEPLKKYNKKEYLHLYMNIMKNVPDAPELVTDSMTTEEFSLICKIGEAEIGNGDFNAKCNVFSSIINRYNDDKFPNDWIKILSQCKNGTYQYTTYGNGSYKNKKISEDTIDALEYVWLVGDTTTGCTYFHSGKSEWHDKNLELIFNDGYHSFYKEKKVGK